MEDDIGRHLSLQRELAAQFAKSIEKRIAHRIGCRIAPPPFGRALGRLDNGDIHLALDDGPRIAAQCQSAMLGRDQCAAGLQCSGDGPQERCFLALDDAEHAQSVMAALFDPLVAIAGEDFLQVAEAEALPGAVGGGQYLAR